MKKVIKVEGLSKRFVIGHEAQERYTALRDVMARKVNRALTSVFNRDKKKYTTEEFWALKNVSFEINQGDRIGIIGRNGAGKSTLLKLLSRITEPTEGRITLHGRVASLLEVGTGFHPELTGRENIFLNGAILGMSRAEIRSKFDEIVAFAEVEKFLDTPVKRYSSGMYVRLAFAVAAHLEPEILIIDEVLAVGDMEFQKKCIGKMDDVSRNDGRTVIFVSHNMSVIKTLCTSGILLSKGQIIDAGSLDRVIQKYLDPAREDKIADYYHREGGKRLRITDVNINGSKDPVVRVFSSIAISIQYDAIEHRRECEFFLLIYNAEGVCIQGSFQEDLNLYTTVNERLGQVELKFDNTLTPGKYYVSAGCFDTDRSFLDWVEFCEGFEVENIYEDNRVFRERLGATIMSNSEWNQMG